MTCIVPQCYANQSESKHLWVQFLWRCNSSVLIACNHVQISRVPRSNNVLRDTSCKEKSIKPACTEVQISLLPKYTPIPRNTWRQDSRLSQKCLMKEDFSSNRSTGPISGRTRLGDVCLLCQLSVMTFVMRRKRVLQCLNVVLFPRDYSTQFAYNE